MRLFADLRYAFRTLFHSPGFAAIAILSLALGAGANVAMFSFVDAILLRPLPVPDPDRIVQIFSNGPGSRFASLSYPDYADLRDQTRTLDTLVCYDMLPVSIAATRDATPKVTLGVIASGNFFSGLGIPVPLGRAFRPDEDQTPGRDLVAVISHAMWERDFASDPSISGRKIRINGSQFTIVGVAPAGFTGPEAFIQPDLYFPMNAYPQAVPNAPAGYLTARDNRHLTVLGRLKPVSTVASAQAEMSTLAARLAAQFPKADRGRGAVVLTFLNARFQQDTIDAILGLTLLAVAGLVLLIACANVANLLLARGTARAREIAIRIAIGASRAALVRQLLIESLLLAVAGGAAGVAVGYAGIRYLGSIRMPSDFPVAMGVRMDARLLAFSLILAIATGIVFGLAPALRFTRADLSTTIKSSDQGPARIGFWRGRLAARNLLVIAQLTFSVVLLVLSAYFVRGFQAARRMDPGFRTDHVLFLSLDPNLVRYDEPATRRFYKNLTGRLRALPGVENVSLSWTLPYDAGRQRFRRILVDGYQPRAGENGPSAIANIVDEHFFPLMQTPLVEGRPFDSRDTADSPRVAIVNQTFARLAWPNRDPIGQRLRLDKPDGPLVQVVGVAKDGKYLYWIEPPQSAVWTPLAQEYDSHMTVELLTQGDPARFAAPARAAIRALDPDMPVSTVSTMAAFYEDRGMLGPRLLAQIVTAIGIAGLLLAVIGLYGVVAYSVTRRTREIGVRIAVGARPRDVLRLVLAQALAFTCAGAALGVLLAIAAAGFFKDFAIGASPRDPATLIAAPLILAAVMFAASWIPARRAAAIDPTRSLRQE